MKIIYCSNGEITPAWVAGLIHLRKFPRNRIPSFQELQTILTPQNILRESGIPVFLGIDDDEHQIYFIDLSKAEKLAYLTIAGIIADYGGQWSFRDLSRIGNNLLRWGRILQQIGMVQVGRRLIIRGIQHCYLQLTNLVFEPTGLSGIQECAF